jgi:hypothetical protein
MLAAVALLNRNPWNLAGRGQHKIGMLDSIFASIRRPNDERLKWYRVKQLTNSSFHIPVAIYAVQTLLSNTLLRCCILCSATLDIPVRSAATVLTGSTVIPSFGRHSVVDPIAGLQSEPGTVQ